MDRYKLEVGSRRVREPNVCFNTVVEHLGSGYNTFQQVDI